MPPVLATLKAISECVRDCLLCPMVGLVSALLPDALARTFMGMTESVMPEKSKYAVKLSNIMSLSNISITYERLKMIVLT